MKEAIDYTDRAIEDAKYRGDTTIKVIVGSSFLSTDNGLFCLQRRVSRPGKGLHSSGGVAKLKPAIEALMQKYELRLSDHSRRLCSDVSFHPTGMIWSRNWIQTTPEC